MSQSSWRCLAHTDNGTAPPSTGPTQRDSLIIEQESDVLRVGQPSHLLTTELSRQSVAPSRFRGGHLCVAGWTIRDPVVIEPF